MNSERLAFIGLGVMGEPMATRLVGVGYRLAVYNCSDPPVERLATLGALRAAGAREAAVGAAVVITMLPDGPDVERVSHGPVGILAGLDRAATWIEMSTIAPATARALAAEARRLGAGFLDAPVSGGTMCARAGTLTIMVGGEESALDRVRPVLERLGLADNSGRVCRGWPNRQGRNQLVVGGTIGLVAEALTVAESLGADPAPVAEALSGGSAASRVLELATDARALIRPGFRCALQSRDLGIVSAAAEACGLQLGLATAARELFQRQCNAGGGDLDHSAAIDAVRHA